MPELDTEGLQRAVDEAIPKRNAGQRAVLDADEIVMCRRYCVEAVNLSRRDNIRRNLPF